MRLSLPASENGHIMLEKTVEISTKGKWATVPALEIDGNTIITRGRWVRIALIHDEEWIETDLERPELCIQTFRDQASAGLRANIFTFSQKPSNPLRHYFFTESIQACSALLLTHGVGQHRDRSRDYLQGVVGGVTTGNSQERAAVTEARSSS